MLPLRLTRNVYLIYFASYMNYHHHHAEEISIFSTIKMLSINIQISALKMTKIFRYAL
ncbi:hypothetical protein NGUA18_00061 [Salmonella enterica]|nr:hypothetical protein SEEM6152_19635 [Salmonella enterica subsp. enterica serovar Montevideo str. 556152]ESG87811.1 hypothetical protein SEEJ0720_21876 [Salmonella enterica subsp. enterica serovar Javiana str. PRS_2010_0720]GAR72206.1 hypothetical protein NGUA18_00061 [Salmonella enterica]